MASKHRCCVHVKRVEKELDEAAHKIVDLSNCAHYDRQTQRIMQGRIDDIVRKVDYWYNRYRGAMRDAERLRGQLSTVMGVSASALRTNLVVDEYPKLPVDPLAEGYSEGISGEQPDTYYPMGEDQ